MARSFEDSVHQSDHNHSCPQIRMNYLQSWNEVEKVTRTFLNGLQFVQLDIGLIVAYTR